MLKEKFLWEERKLALYLPEFWRIGFRVEPVERVEMIADDPDDDGILECALSPRAEVIVSGDRHLPKLGSFEGISIRTPRQFLETYMRRL